MARATKKEIEDFIKHLKVCATDPNDLVPTPEDIDLLVECIREECRLGEDE